MKRTYNNTEYDIDSEVLEDGDVLVCIPSLGKHLFRAIGDSEEEALEILDSIFPTVWEWWEEQRFVDVLGIDEKTLKANISLIKKTFPDATLEFYLDYEVEVADLPLAGMRILRNAKYIETLDIINTIRNDIKYMSLTP